MQDVLFFLGECCPLHGLASGLAAAWFSLWAAYLLGGRIRDFTRKLGLDVRDLDGKGVCGDRDQDA